MPDEPFLEPPPSTKRRYWSIEPDMSDEELHAWADHVAEALIADAVEQGLVPRNAQTLEGGDQSCESSGGRDGLD